MKTPSVLSASIALCLGLSISTLPARAAEVRWDGDAGTSWASALNWSLDVAPVADDSLVFAGAFNTAASNNITANTRFTGLTFDTTAASFNLTGNAINLGGDIVDYSLNAQTIGLSETLTATRTVNVSSIDGSLTISAPVSGVGFGLTKTGSGLLTLSGPNTFTGRVTVSGGTLAIASDGTSPSNPLGSGANGAGLLVLDGGALRTTLALNLSTNRGIRLGNAGGGGGTIDTASSGTTIYNGVMANNNGGTNSLTKTGVGILALGGVNTYTGRTFVNLGTLKLDFSALVGTTSNIINAASTLVLGGVSTALGNANATGPVSTTAGATLSMVSKNNANSTQTFSGVTFNGGYSTIQTVQTGAGRNLLTLGIITRSSATSALTGYNAAYGGLVNFSFAGTLSANNAIKTGTGNTNNILGGWATYQAGAGAPIADYAAIDGMGNIIAYTGYTTQQTGTLASNALLNYQSSHSSAAWSTGTGITDFNTLSIRSDTTGASTLTPAASSTLRLGATGGFLIGSTAATLAIGNGSGSATLTAGGAPNTPGEISFISSNTTTNTTGFDISMKIADNGAGGIVSVTFGGTQGSGSSTQGAIAELSGTNTYTGGTTITTGRVIANNSDAFGTGSVTVYSGAQAYLAVGGTYANNWNIAGAGTSIPSGSPGSYAIPSALRIGSNNTTLTGIITLLGDATINNRSSTNDVLSGKITGPYNLILSSSGTTGSGGTITLSNPGNDWSGNLLIDSKQLLLGADEVLPNGATKGNIILNNTANSILDLNGKSETINGLASLGSAPFVQNNLNATASMLTVGGGDATATFSGIIRDNSGGTGGTLALKKTGAGTQTLTGTNTYSGPTTVQAGVLRITGPQTGAGAVTVTGGTLFLSGSGSINGSSGVTLNDAGAKFVQNSTTLVSPLVALMQGGVQGTGSIVTMNVDNLAANTITTGFAGSGRLTVNTLNFAGAATVNVTSTNYLATTNLSTGAGTVTINASGAWTTDTTYDLISHSGPIGGTGLSAFATGTIAGLVGRQIASAPNDTGSAVAITISNDTLVWTGGAGTAWTQVPVGNPFNWKLQTGGGGTEFLNNDRVLFEDIFSTGSTNVAINDATATPLATTFTNTFTDYMLTGSAGILTGSLTKNGGGTLTLQNVNSYPGVTTLAGGVVDAATFANYDSPGSPGSLGNRAAIADVAEAGLIFQGGTLQYTGGTPQSTDRAISVSLLSGGTIDASGSAPSATLSFTAASSPNFWTGAGAGGALTFTGTHTGNNTFALTIPFSLSATTVVKNGPGTWVLSGDSSYSGNTSINEGTLRIATNSALGTSIVTMNGGTLSATVAELDIPNNFDATAAGTFEVTNSFTLSGLFVSTTAGIQTVTGAGTLTLSHANNSIRFNTGDAGLFVIGGATLNITGSTTVTGGDTANAGYLEIGGAGVIGNGGGNGTVTVPDGGSLTISGAMNAGVTSSIIGQDGMTGTLNVNGGSVTFGPYTDVILANAFNGAVGTVNVNSGTLTVAKGDVTNGLYGANTTVIMMGRANPNSGPTNATGIINLNGGTFNGGTFATGRQFVRGGVTGSAGLAYFNFNGGTLQALADQPDWLCSTDTTAPLLALTATTVKFGGAKVDTNGFNVGINNLLAHDVTLPANILDGGLTKTGAGTLTLTNAANSYTGRTVFAGGVVNAATFANYNFTSSLGYRPDTADVPGADTGLLFQGGALQYTGTTPQSTSRAVTFSRIGGGTIDASGANATINTPSATLKFTATSSPQFWTDSAPLFGGTITLNGSNTGDNTFALTIPDSGTFSPAIIKEGPGMWILSGNNGYAGPTLVKAGTLRLTSSSALGASGTNTFNWTIVLDRAALELQGGATPNGISVPEHFHFNGVGPAGKGGLRSVSGDNSLTNAFALDSNSSIGVDTDSLTTTAVIYQDTPIPGVHGRFALTKIGDGTLNFNGPVAIDTLNTNAGTTNLNNVLLNSDGVIGATLNANATTNISVSQTLAALNIADGVVVTLGPAGMSPAVEADGFGERTFFAPGDGGAAVPEPGALALLLAGAIGFLSRRRRS